MSRGRFITFEGGEGTGKTTQIALLKETLEAKGIKVITTREPGGTNGAEMIRDLLVQRDTEDWHPSTEVLLLFAARNEHLIKKIYPALEDGVWVISDRFTDSTRVYQGHVMNVPEDYIEQTKRLIMGKLEPDLTFIFDLDPEEGLKRSMKQLDATNNHVEATEDRYESKGLEFHKNLRQGYLKIAKDFSSRCVLVDTASSIDDVSIQVLTAVTDRLLKEVA